jgi:hypothetical protein
MADDDYKQAVQAAVDAAATAPALDTQAAFALAGSYYKNVQTGRIAVNFGPGWTEVLRSDAEGGYDGIALSHDLSATLVIVNRGTEGLRSFDDWKENIGAALFNAPGPQMDSAFKLLLDSYNALDPAKVAQILICGHSLGGALADAQGALAASLFDKNGLTCPPVKVVGVASAGFAHAAEGYAASQGLTPDPNAAHFITHYIRARDIVPHHPGRSVFGTDQIVASVYEARRQPQPGPHSQGQYWYEWLAEPLRQHDCNLYFAFYDQPGSNYVWYSHDADAYSVAPGAQPAWTPSLLRPDNY